MKYKNKYQVERIKEDKGIKVDGPRRLTENTNYIIPDYKNIQNNQNIKFAFLGHSSIYLIINNHHILIDPVFSKKITPFGPKRFNIGAPKNDDFPNIDAILISHNHYDHLDLKTIKQFANQTKFFIVPVGNKNLLIRNNIPENKIVELDLYQNKYLGDIKITCTPAHHNSCRYLFDFDNSLCCSYAIEYKNTSIFFSGDSAYSKHFKDIKEKFNSFTLAFMECGQYGEKWHSSHMFPNETIEAIKDINAQIAVPIHNSAYSLSNHSYNEPTIRFKIEADKKGINYLMPELYKIYALDDLYR